VTFETGQVRPLLISADGQRLYATNTPDNRLEIFAIGNGQASTDAGVDAAVTVSGHLTPIGAVLVGIEPIAIGEAPDGKVWVVNHLSDSVSIVDVQATPPRVVQTLWVGDEPRDIVFGSAPAAGRVKRRTACLCRDLPFR
jgi:YVTN family beta-propeller protein